MIMRDNEFKYDLYFNEEGTTLEDMLEELIVEDMEVKNSVRNNTY